MCGRFVSPAEAEIERHWQLKRESTNPFARHYNVAPSLLVPILKINDVGELELTVARWGLIPHWWTDKKPPRNSINACAEDAAIKPMWRDALRFARCLVPAVGWYEWQVLERVDQATGEMQTIKQPRFIRRHDGSIIAFGGLMSLYKDQGEPTLTCAILTKGASASVTNVHDRMPVVLPDEAHTAWLNPTVKDAGKAAQIIHDCASADFERYPVSTAVNDAKKEDPSLIERAQ